MLSDVMHDACESARQYLVGHPLSAGYFPHRDRVEKVLFLMDAIRLCEDAPPAGFEPEVGAIWDALRAMDITPVRRAVDEYYRRVGHVREQDILDDLGPIA